MNEENNNLGLNTNPVNNEQTMPTAEPTVTPVAPAEPVQTPAPVAPVEPVQQPTEPVQAPVEPAIPVAAAEPVAPVAPAQTPAPAQPVAETPTVTPVSQPAVTSPEPANGKKNPTFLIIVIVLVVCILGLGGYVISNLVGKNNKTSGNATTTITTKEETVTSKRNVTTIANTTTAVRTTKGADTPKPVNSGTNTIKVGKYTFPLPSGYEVYNGNSSIDQAVNKSEQVVLGFTAVNVKFNDILKDYGTVEANLQSAGFEIGESITGTYGTRQWAVTLLGGSQVKSGYRYYYLVTPLDDTTSLEIYAYLKAETSTEENLLDILNRIVDGKTQVFAGEEKEIDSEVNIKILDDLDERLLD